MKKIVISASAVSLLVIVVIMFLSLRDDLASFPLEVDITEIRVKLNGFRPEMNGFITNDFTVAKDDYGQFLNLIANVQRTKDPMKWQGLGAVTIKSSGEQITAIELYSTYETQGAFSIGRKYFRTSNEPAMMKFLMASDRTTKTKK